MKFGPAVGLLASAMFGLAMPAFAQAPRADAIWARRSLSPITLNGVLSEPAWAKAESVIIRFGKDTGIPGSGWKVEGGPANPQDSTYAVLKWLVVGNQLYLGANVKEKSVGGSKDFNRFDGFLMSLKDHSSPNAPKPPTEYTYVWWYPTLPEPQPAGQSPSFIGKWATWPPGTPRNATQIANWDAVTVVHGVSNSDATLDTGYTVEMRFNLTPMGYDVTRGSGDIIEWNISVYDCDWLWPIDVSRLGFNRVWAQGPWANAAWYDEIHIYARPDVDIATTTLPTIRPEVYVPNGAAFATPTIDGTLSDAAWGSAYTFDIHYGDDALRATYPGVGPSRAGQYQPPVNGGQAAVLDPADATVKLFFKGNFLYLGFDVRDRVVEYHPSFDRWDGFLVTLNDHTVRGPDQNLIGRRLSFQVSQGGTALPQDYLSTMVTAGDAQVAIQLKPGTTVDTLGTTADTGYTAELALDLTKLGYPPGLGDGSLWLGVNLLDGDSFQPFTDSYGTRTWWGREYENDCCPMWCYLAPTPPTGTGPADQLDGYVLLGASPNPSMRSTIRYSIAKQSDVKLEVFDVRGRLVRKAELGVQPGGMRETPFDGTGLGAGMYMYRLNMTDPATGASRTSLYGRIIVVK